MRRYLLDTPLVSAFLNNRPGAVALIQPWIIAHEAATSVLVYGEVIEYVKTSQRYPHYHASLRRLLRSVYPVLPHSGHS